MWIERLKCGMHGSDASTLHWLNARVFLIFLHENGVLLGHLIYVRILDYLMAHNSHISQVNFFVMNNNIFNRWMETVLKEKLPPTTELEENLQNGVYLAKLGNVIAPETVPLTKIYDIDQKFYKAAGLQFRHTDNINYWLKSLETASLPVVSVELVLFL
jgi:hypothetical protein